MAISDFSFDCPVCSGFRYRPLAAPGRLAKGFTYVCACCGFTFVDPRRYREFLTPYSTIQLQGEQQENRSAAQQGLLAAMALQRNDV